jgi:hypothetical protein
MLAPETPFADLRVLIVDAVLLTSADFDEHFYARADASGARGFVPKSQLAQVELERFWPGITAAD